MGLGYASQRGTNWRWMRSCHVARCPFLVSFSAVSVSLLDCGLLLRLRCCQFTLIRAATPILAAHAEATQQTLRSLQNILAVFGCRWQKFSLWKFKAGGNYSLMKPRKHWTTSASMWTKSPWALVKCRTSTLKSPYFTVFTIACLWNESFLPNGINHRTYFLGWVNTCN